MEKISVEFTKSEMQQLFHFLGSQLEGMKHHTTLSFEAHKQILRAILKRYINKFAIPKESNKISLKLYEADWLFCRMGDHWLEQTMQTKILEAFSHAHEKESMMRMNLMLNSSQHLLT